MKQSHEREFDDIWTSLEPEIREDAERLDHRLRTIWTEATTCGVPRAVIERLLAERFWEMVRGMGERDAIR